MLVIRVRTEKRMPYAPRANNDRYAANAVNADTRPDVRSGRAKSSAAWAVAGFVVGALFWHTIGFWSFVQSTLLPGSDARRAERDTSVAETRSTSNAAMRSPVRPTRTGHKTATKLTDAPDATSVPVSQADVPAPVPTILNPTEIAECVTLSRAAPGSAVFLTPCAPLTAPLVSGTGVKLADREAVKPVAISQPAALMWQAKVEVSADRR